MALGRGHATIREPPGLGLGLVDDALGGAADPGCVVLPCCECEGIVLREGGK